jgi:hypothetical protein
MEETDRSVPEFRMEEVGSHGYDSRRSHHLEV